MVIAGINNRYIQGVIAKSGSRFAYPADNILKDESGKIHRNKPIVRRNTTTTIYPIREFKKLLISLRIRENIGGKSN